VAAAVIAVGAPVSVGAMSPEPAQRARPEATADPLQGGWVRFAGPQGLQLARISEDSEVWPIVLPPLLQTETNGEFGGVLTPLRSGWLVEVAPNASNARTPGSRQKRVASSRSRSSHRPAGGRRRNRCPARVAATPLRLNPWKSVAGGSSSPGKKVRRGYRRSASRSAGSAQGLAGPVARSG
jgi:hypothetical protein